MSAAFALCVAVTNKLAFPACRPRCDSDNPVGSYLESLMATQLSQWSRSRSVTSAWRLLFSTTCSSVAVTFFAQRVSLLNARDCVYVRRVQTVRVLSSVGRLAPVPVLSCPVHGSAGRSWSTTCDQVNARSPTSHWWSPRLYVRSSHYWSPSYTTTGSPSTWCMLSLSTRRERVMTELVMHTASPQVRQFTTVTIRQHQGRNHAEIYLGMFSPRDGRWSISLNPTH